MSLAYVVVTLNLIVNQISQWSCYVLKIWCKEHFMLRVMETSVTHLKLEGFFDMTLGIITSMNADLQDKNLCSYIRKVKMKAGEVILLTHHLLVDQGVQVVNV